MKSRRKRRENLGGIGCLAGVAAFLLLFAAVVSYVWRSPAEIYFAGLGIGISGPKCSGRLPPFVVGPRRERQHFTGFQLGPFRIDEYIEVE